MEYVPGQETYIPQQEHHDSFGTPENLYLELQNASNKFGMDLFDDGGNSTTILIIVLVVILVIVLLIICCCCCACCALAGAAKELEEKAKMEAAEKEKMMEGEAAAPMMEAPAMEWFQILYNRYVRKE